MKITALNIGHFGKLHNVQLRFGDGLNLVTGDNETGKSTIYAFIGAMLFGLDRKRGKAGRDDLYTRYRPWDAPAEYRGSMDFVHEGREYRLLRIFYLKERKCVLTDIANGKQIPLVDDSITFLIPELTVSAYYNSVGMGQKALRSTADFGNEVRNYIANLATTGGSRVNVPAALQELTNRRKACERRLEENNIEESENRKIELFKIEEESLELAAEASRLAAEAEKAECELEQVRNSYPDTEKLFEEWKAARENVEAVSFERPAEAPKRKVRYTEWYLLVAGAVLALAGNNRSVLCIALGIALLIAGIIVMMLSLIKRAEEKRQKIGEAGNDAGEEAVEEKYDALDRAAEKLDEARRKQDSLISEERRLNALITDINSELDRVEWRLEKIGDIGTELEECESDIEDIKQQRYVLEREIEALKLAESTISRLTGELQDSFSENFNDILSEEICLATDGHYLRGIVNDNFEIEVMNDNGYVPAEALSGGTAEQLYMALRFAVSRLMFNGMSIPLLLDESFAYSDDARLKSALSALSDRDDAQIILFTCHRREKSLLDELGAEYTFIDLN